MLFFSALSVGSTVLSSSLSGKDEWSLYVGVYILFRIDSDEYSLLLVQTQSLAKRVAVLYTDVVWDENTHAGSIS